MIDLNRPSRRRVLPLAELDRERWLGQASLAARQPRTGYEIPRV